MDKIRFICFASLLVGILLWVGGDRLAAEGYDGGEILSGSTVSKPTWRR